MSLEKVNEIWHIEIEDVIKKTRAKLRYDAVIIANGHFSNPYIPDVPGLSSWNKITQVQSLTPNITSHQPNLETNVFWWLEIRQVE